MTPAVTLGLCLSLLALGAGCGPGRRVDAGGSPHSAHATADAAVPPARAARPVPTAPTAPAAIDPATLGFGEETEVPARAAGEAITAARRLLAGRESATEALERAQAALETAPGSVAAHLLHARALARLDRVDEAAGEIEPLLRSDLPEVLAQLEADEALAEVRTRLAAPRAAVEAAWVDAARRGIPAGVGGRLPGYIPRIRTVRAGVWLTTERRFLPMAPTLEAPLGSGGIVDGLYDPAVRRVVAVAGSVWGARPPRYDEWSAWVMASPSGAPLGRLDLQGGECDDDPIDLDVQATGEGAHVGILDLTRPLRSLKWRDLDTRGARRSAEQRALPGLHLRLRNGVGFVTVEPPEGVRLDGESLVTPAATVALGRGHGRARIHSVVLRPDGGEAVVVSIRVGSLGQEAPRTVVDRVDLRAGTARRLFEGTRWAAALYAPDGALFVQTGARLDRHPPDGGPPEQMPDWVSLGLQPDR